MVGLSRHTDTPLPRRVIDDCRRDIARYPRIDDEWRGGDVREEQSGS